jgi:hypothetical protein
VPTAGPIQVNRIHMWNKPLFTWIALCAVGVLATNGLLALHLWGCHGHVSDSCDSSPSDHHDSHDSEHCQICQILLVHSAKYIADSPVPAPWVELVLIHPLPVCRAGYSQTNSSASVPRGPPV